MIHTVYPLPIGNAMRLFLTPPAGAVQWRILRKGDDSFTGPDDAASVRIYEGDEPVVLDTKALKNDVLYYYRPYYLVGGTWQAGPSASGTPSATYEDASTDVQNIVRRRLAEGLAVEVARGPLRNKHNQIRVVWGPPQITDDLLFPLVTIELESESPPDRGLGEDMQGDDFQVIGGFWRESEGWLAEVSLKITGWSLNPDERINLRHAIRRVIVGNLPVFDDAGMVRIDLSSQDANFTDGEFDVPLFACVNTFTCLAPVIVRSQVGAIEDVDVNVDVSIPITQP
jgi:hypothetical protein